MSICMIVQIWEVKTVASYARAETFTEAVASMVALPLVVATCIMVHAAVANAYKLVLYNIRSEMSIICKVYSGIATF